MGFISKLSDDLSAKIPEKILKKAGLKPGIEITWFYDEGTG